VPALSFLSGRSVEVIAHRGASHDAPENTLAAVRLAWEQGADACEFDVHLTGDGRLVAIHDADTRRTAGPPGLVVGDSPLAALRTLDVGRWKGEAFAGERVPTLEEMLGTVPAGKRVFVEVKGGPAAVPELCRVLAGSGLDPGRTVVIAFDPAVVSAVKQARPDVPACWLLDLAGRVPAAPVADLIARAQELRADGLDVSARPGLDAAFAGAVRRAGLGLFVWTVNHPVEATRLVGLGVDGITTDRPAWLREQLAD
jgi:glycerophosphoryl diester phosphodiesterase